MSSDRLCPQLHVVHGGGRLDGRQRDRRHPCGATTRRRAQPARGLVLQPPQRAPRGDRRRERVRLAERVVEDLQRDRAVVPRPHQVTHEGAEVEAALPREEPMVPAPREDVHGQERGIRQLDEEDLVGGDRLDRFRVVALRQDVEAVEAHSDAIVVGETDDAGGHLVAVDEATPRERLIGDPHAEPLGEIAQLAQLGGGELLIAAARRRDVAAQEHGLDAETIHERELRRRSSEVLLEQVGADAFEVAERLVEIERQAELVGARPDRLGRGGRGDQVGLEDLHPIEPCVARGDELLIERSAEADRGDRRAHDTFLRPPALVPRDSSQ